MTLDEKARVRKQAAAAFHEQLRVVARDHQRDPRFYAGYAHAAHECIRHLEQILAQIERTLEP